jgi:Nitrogen regulatory protein P-II
MVLPKLRVEVLVHDELVTAATKAIVKSVHTSAVGDGKIWLCCGSRDATARGLAGPVPGKSIVSMPPCQSGGDDPRTPR